MKYTEMHNGLENQYLRDFFSNELVHAIFFIPMKNTERQEKMAISWKQPCAIDTTLIRLTVEKEAIDREIKSALKIKSLLLLIEDKGWNEHDISDYIPADENEHYHNFIGTKEEYDNLVKKLEK